MSVALRIPYSRLRIIKMSSFQFKQFAINQDRTAMKVGTDGVLLGAWFDANGYADHREDMSTFNRHLPLRILDIGTGTGLLALMAAQRYPSANVDAVELDPDAARQAAENVAESPFGGRITVYNTDITLFAPSGVYNSIICNPPYFVDSLRCPDESRTRARHDDTLSLDTLVSQAVRLLSDYGTLHVVIPYSELNRFTDIGHLHNMAPTRITTVYPTPTAAAKRALITVRYCPSASIAATMPPPTTDRLVVELSRHQYTPEYIGLTRQFYLKM